MSSFAVAQFPGTNCERETARILRHDLGQNVEVLWHADSVALDAFDAVVLPGGFASGDHLRAGAIARFSPLMRQVETFANAGGLVAGICNGFQVLLEAGLLPGAMLHNAVQQFRSEWVWRRVERTDTPFTSAYTPGQLLRLPIAHGEGNFTIADHDALTRLEARSQVRLRYADESGEFTAGANPNGSVANIAGILNEAGNVMGLMPHPERASEALLGSEDGRLLFESMINWLAAHPRTQAERGLVEAASLA